MDVITKKRILISAIVILLIMNISALSTIAYYKYSSKKHIEQIREKKKKRGELYRGKNYGQRVKRYVRKELNLSNEQFKEYSRLKDINMQKSRDLWKQISEKRSLTFKEYCKENPDTVLLMHLSEDIGNLHKEIHREMIRHFNEVEKILSPEQLIKFRKMLCKMANNTHHRGSNKFSLK